MSDLLEKIYEEFAVYSEKNYEANHKLESDVENMIKPHTRKLSGKEKEALEDTFFDVCAAGKYVGFCMGMKFCFRLIIELLSD